jgi:LysM repeat protein
MTVVGQDPVEPQHAPTSPDGLPDRQSSGRHPERPTTGTVCPYLMAESGGWRSASPNREHRCGAVDPPAPLSADKQRRLCLTLAHQTCPTYGAARGARAAAIAPGVDPAVLAAVEAARRPVARSATVILEAPRLTSPRVAWPLDRAVSQAALVGLMLVAFALVAIARLSAGNAGPATSPSPAASVAIGAPSPSSSTEPIVTPSPSSSEVAPSDSVAPSLSVGPSVTPPTTPTYRTTYAVRSGDTLAGIAAKYKTTATAIKKLNGLTNNTIHIGQKLKIP